VEALVWGGGLVAPKVRKIGNGVSTRKRRGKEKRASQRIFDGEQESWNRAKQTSIPRGIWFSDLKRRGGKNRKRVNWVKGAK